MPELVGALDQGTTSTRFMVFDREGRVRARAQLEHAQGLPRPGWVEHDPVEIRDNAVAVVGRALDEAGLTPADLVACGITNQRETTVVWDRRTGRPYGPAIVWQDTRTDAVVTAVAERDDGRGGDLIRSRTGLLPATYFAGGKLAWILREDPEVRADAEAGHALFGTVDTWLVWHLSGRHVTDVTNASRTMLMDLHTLDWDDELLALFDIPRRMLPAIVASNGTDQFGAGRPDGPLPGVPVTAVLGDQHAATVGQTCFAPGEAKNTYGTGNFLLLNTGPTPTASDRGLLTTVAYRFEGAAPVYALEGSIAVTGSAVQWLRDQLGLIDDAAGIEPLARQVDDSGGVYFVPAFSGLYAPYWRPDARGAIVGLSRFDSAAHLARATLEAICFQTRDVVDAMAADSGVALDVLKVDGGVTANDLCMQIQADVLGVAVSRPSVTETTALGAAFAAGLAVGYWASTDDLRATWHEDGHWEPTWSADRRETAYAGWNKAVTRTLDWVDPPDGDASAAGGDRT